MIASPPFARTFGGDATPHEAAIKPFIGWFKAASP